VAECVDAVQVIYNIFDQAPEDRLFPLCRERNIAVIARVPFDEGTLAGAVTRDTKFPAGDWRASYFVPENLEASVERVDRLKEVLSPEMTLAHLALRFILSNPDVSTTIPGMRRKNHVMSNISAGEVGPLSRSLLDELRKHRWDRKPTTLVSVGTFVALWQRHERMPRVTLSARPIAPAGILIDADPRRFSGRSPPQSAHSCSSVQTG